ncbi:hypothetical protein MMC10_005417 [Thelotrema lepadinum]|nr:hypothetical protein [Thelotrema lepadinum]
MGHYIPNPEDAEREIHVLVTGAGPFYSNNTNPASLIAANLPAALRARTHSGAGAAAVTIHVHATPHPWRVAYAWVREHIPPMLFPPDPGPEPDPPSSPPSPHPPPPPDPPELPSLDIPPPTTSSPTGPADPAASKGPRPNYDLTLFIGMAGPRAYYSLETQAHRDGYLFPDEDGQTMEGDALWAGWGAPAVLEPGFDSEDVWRRWKGGLMDEDVRPSKDAGHFLCDFIFYTGLVEYWRRDPDQDRPVMFLHVPGDYSEGAVQKGVRVTSGLIVALVQSHLDRGKLG